MSRERGRSREDDDEQLERDVEESFAFSFISVSIYLLGKRARLGDNSTGGDVNLALGLSRVGSLLLDGLHDVETGDNLSEDDVLACRAKQSVSQCTKDGVMRWEGAGEEG